MAILLSLLLFHSIFVFTTQLSEVRIECTKDNLSFGTPSKLCRWIRYDLITHISTPGLLTFQDAVNDCPDYYEIASLLNFTSNIVINSTECYEIYMAWINPAFVSDKYLITIAANKTATINSAIVKILQHFICEPCESTEVVNQVGPLDCSTFSYEKTKTDEISSTRSTFTTTETTTPTLTTAETITSIMTTAETTTSALTTTETTTSTLTTTENTTTTFKTSTTSTATTINTTIAPASGTTKASTTTSTFTTTKTTTTTFKTSTTSTATTINSTKATTTTFQKSTQNTSATTTTTTSTKYSNSSSTTIYSIILKNQTWYTISCAIQKKRKSQTGAIEILYFIIKDLQLCDNLDNFTTARRIVELKQQEKDAITEIQIKTAYIIANITAEESKYKTIAVKSYSYIAIILIICMYAIAFLIDVSKLKLFNSKNQPKHSSKYELSILSAANEESYQAFKQVRKANEIIKNKYKKTFSKNLTLN